ncbi:MAG: acyl-CoA dehydrogenase [Acidimicrobiia bacterium]|nr:acyl-CoA dehydrogenase [Acidimicrobiia bacterium]
MTEYRAPLNDIRFVLENIVDIQAISELNGYQHADPETAAGVLAEAGRFFSEVIAPLNAIGDQQGSRLVDGAVVTPDGFREAYTKYVESGWAGVHMPEQWGGGGFPYAVGIVIQEMFKSANMAFSLCPLLTQAAIDALLEHGSDEQRALYLEKLISGEWTGTMCLTEPHAGSDVGALSAKAEPVGDGTYAITGQKIFITWGDQDLTDNIVQLVLARTPGAGPGTKGISLFIVPKILGDGARNSYEIVSLEHKLGIHASPTCVISFDKAIGTLVGEENQGMRYMFTMMNAARIAVGVEGLAIAERAYQKATEYALERRQGRAVGTAPGESSLIIEHPDIRRSLMTMRSTIEAMRCLLYDTAGASDVQAHGATDEDRTRAGERVALMTPLCKAWSTDRGVELASIGLQVHGGMGYVEETGAAQYYRDVRIAPIYEGTNGIQAIDLVLRKLPMRDGAVVRELLDEMVATVNDPDLDPEVGAALEMAIASLRRATEGLLGLLAESRYDDALAGATPYLDMFGTTVGGWYMARSLASAQRLIAHGSADGPYLQSKTTSARFYCTQLLPRAAGHEQAVLAGAGPLFAIDADSLTVR